uniref:Ubiquitin-like protease family profile domain-containing protein n=1 Tax=Trichobilharzia regenti TaxID=157069 RepID=A0AA85JIB9_TRIRE|nr:unnamed protein product [Trichobilharzia regenti]
MPRQVQDPNGKKSLNVNNESNRILWKCTQANCQGFVSRTDHKCSLCKKLSSFPNTALASISKGNTINITANDTLSVKRPRTSSDSHLVPLNIFSIGRSGIYDGRSEDCCITSSSILCRVKVEGVWTNLSIHANDIEMLVFCESLQVLFLKPYDSYKSQLSNHLKLRDFVLRKVSGGHFISVWCANVKWLVFVFREPSTSEPLYLTVSNLEGLANKIGRSGVCDMQCSSENAREILSSCGLRLPRSELRRTGTASTEPSIINRIVQGQALADTHYSVEPSSSQTVKYVNEGGLLTNVINTLTNNGFQLKTNSGSATHESNVNCRGKSETNELDEECDDLIIIHEENTSNVAAQPPGDNVQAESTTNCDEDSFKFDYKPAGSVDGITLTKSDLQCLEPGALINDAIINFYLKYLYFEQLTDFQRQATHVFNVFFYSRLTGGNVSVDTRNSTVTETTTEMILARHANVAKWTRRVDLFSKDYIIIPINESSHWFVALVCYPWMAGMVSYTALYDEQVYHLCQLTEEFADVDLIEFSGDPHLSNIGEEVIQRLPTDFQGQAFDRWRRKRLAWLRKCGINAMPCILLFDSYPVQTRITNLSTIRE